LCEKKGTRWYGERGGMFMRLFVFIVLHIFLFWGPNSHAQKAKSDKTTQYLDGYGKPIVVDGAWLKSICTYSQKEGDYFCDEKKLPAKKRTVSKKAPEPTNLSSPETQGVVDAETGDPSTWVPVSLEVKQKVLKESFSRLPKPKAPEVNLKKPIKPKIKQPASGLLLGGAAGVAVALAFGTYAAVNGYQRWNSVGVGIGYAVGWLLYPVGFVPGTIVGLTIEKVKRDDNQKLLDQYNDEMKFYEKKTKHRIRKNERYHHLRQTIYGEAPAEPVQQPKNQE